MYVVIYIISIKFVVVVRRWQEGWGGGRQLFKGVDHFKYFHQKGAII